MKLLAKMGMVLLAVLAGGIASAQETPPTCRVSWMQWIGNESRYRTSSLLEWSEAWNKAIAYVKCDTGDETSDTVTWPASVVAAVNVPGWGGNIAWRIRMTHVYVNGQMRPMQFPSAWFGENFANRSTPDIYTNSYSMVGMKFYRWLEQEAAAGRPTTGLFDFEIYHQNTGGTVTVLDTRQFKWIGSYLDWRPQSDGTWKPANANTDPESGGGGLDEESKGWLGGLFDGINDLVERAKAMMNPIPSDGWNALVPLIEDLKDYFPFEVIGRILDAFTQNLYTETPSILVPNPFGGPIVEMDLSAYGTWLRIGRTICTIGFLVMVWQTLMKRGETILR